MTAPESGPGDAEQKEKRASAITVRIVVVLLILYFIGVVGYFIHDHLL